MVLVGHSAARMFELVDRVEDYPQFLPWCSGSTVEARDAAVTRATVHISFHGVKTSFSILPASADVGQERRERRRLWRVSGGTHV